MMLRSTHGFVSTRRGKFTVVTAIMTPVILGGMAVSVDFGVLAVARGQLHSMTDSAALAGAMQLATENRVRGANSLTTEMTNARTQAITFARLNQVLGATPVINDNPSNVTTGDVVIGYIDPSATYGSTMKTNSGNEAQFNSV